MEKSSVSCAETGASELDSESTADGRVVGNKFNEEDTVDGFTEEDTVIIEQGNPHASGKPSNSK